jgi:hypothetical protein
MKPTKITNTKPRHEPNRLGDMAEHYAITWLWDNGYHVFKNCGCTGPIDIVALDPCTGPIDIVALDPQGKVTLIDVKSYKDGRLASKTPLQKELNVQYLHYNSLTRKCRFVRHRK